MNNNIHFSSKSNEWSTPQDFFDELNKEFNFDLDVCASKENTKCKKYYNKDEDGLNRNWNKGVWKWMNPPYGREIGKWIAKASKERMTVCLIPARTDTKYFHEYIYETKCRNKIYQRSFKVWWTQEFCTISINGGNI